MQVRNLKILIIDDHQLVRDGIKAMLNSQNDKYVFEIFEARTSEEGVKYILSDNFNIVLLDFQLPDALGPITISKILIQKPRTKILALSGYDEYACVQDMINAGAYGYILKNISPDELIKAIQTVLRGRRYYSPEILKKIKASDNKIEVLNPPPKKLGVTQRQIEILQLVAMGKTNEVIAKELKLAKRTVDVHRQHLIEKMGVQNTASLIKKASELSLI